MKRADGWVVQGLGVAALMVLLGLGLLGPGFVLVHVSNWIGGVR